MLFLTAVSPFGRPPASAPDCVKSRLGPAAREAFVRAYREQLSTAQREQALAFYGSEAGQAALALRAAHERTAFEAALARKSVDESSLRYPPALQRALDDFHATPAGRKFEGETAIDRQQGIEQLRNEVLVACLRGS